eukprot:jgi/Psemu1/44629/gm1.44629_g
MKNFLDCLMAKSSLRFSMSHSYNQVDLDKHFKLKRDTNILKTCQVLLPLHSPLVFHYVLNYKDTVSNYYNIHFEFDDGRVTLSTCKLGTGKIDLAHFTEILSKVLKVHDNGCFGYEHVMETMGDLTQFAHVKFEDTPEQLVTGLLELLGLEAKHNNQTCVTWFLQYNINSQQEVHQHIFMEHISYVFRKIFVIDPEVVKRYTLVQELILYRYLPEMGTIFSPLTEKLAGYLLKKSDDLLLADLLVEFLDKNVVNNYGRGTGELNPAFNHLQGCDFVFNKLLDFETWDCFKTSKDHSQNKRNHPHKETNKERGSPDTGESLKKKANQSKPSGIDTTKDNSKDAGTGDGEKNNKHGSTETGNSSKQKPDKSTPSLNGDNAEVAKLSSNAKSSEMDEHDDTNKTEEEVPHWAIPLIRCQTTVVPTRCTVLSKDYTKRMHELNHDDLNNDGNPFLYHFKTGFDALCAKNGHLVLTIPHGCQKIEEVRKKLNSKKGHFEEDEALNIWEQCFKYIIEEVFPGYKEGNTDRIDHVWAMGVILAYISCGYPTLKTTEDIKCYDIMGIGPEVKSIEQERMIQDGHTFPAKEWCNLTPEAREHIKQCIHYNPGNRPCMTCIWYNNWRKRTNEAIIDNNR